MLRVPEPPIPEEERYLFRIGRSGLLPGIISLLIALLLGAFAVGILTTDELGPDPLVDRYFPAGMVGVFAFASLAVAVVSIGEAVNAQVQIAGGEIIIHNWRGAEERARLDDIWAMRMRFGSRALAYGVRYTMSRVRVDLLPRDEDADPVAVIRTYWWGRLHNPPDEYTRLTAAIAGRRQMALISDDISPWVLISKRAERVRYWRR